MTVDLHSHTTISDGVLEPRDLVRAAARAGITVLSGTDHDTVEAVTECTDESERLGIRVIPGVEISSFVADPTEPDPAKAERNLHVLGYFSPGSVSGLFEWQMERRKMIGFTFVEILRRLAIPCRADFWKPWLAIDSRFRKKAAAGSLLPTR